MEKKVSTRNNHELSSKVLIHPCKCDEKNKRALDEAHEIFTCLDALFCVVSTSHTISLSSSYQQMKCKLTWPGLSINRTNIHLLTDYSKNYDYWIVVWVLSVTMSMWTCGVMKRAKSWIIIIYSLSCAFIIENLKFSNRNVSVNEYKLLSSGSLALGSSSEGWSSIPTFSGFRHLLLSIMDMPSWWNYALLTPEHNIPLMQLLLMAHWK